METGEDDRSVISVSKAASARREPQDLVRERVHRFMRLLPEVLNSEQSEAVHDLRVWSRRSQQVLVAMFPSNQEVRANSVVRALRRARRALSGWRDCDVLIALLERKLRRLRSPDERRGWQVVHNYLIRKREKEIRRSRRRLARRALFTLGQKTEDLLRQRELQPTSSTSVEQADLIVIVLDLIKTAYTEWRAALATALQSVNPADSHTFRIKTKHLRYRLELARDLGVDELRLQLHSLKSLQDRLGEWHDRAELARIATEAIADAEVLSKEPRAASLVLRRIARELLSETNKLKSLLTAVEEGGDARGLEAWLTSHSAIAGSPSDQSLES